MMLKTNERIVSVTVTALVGRHDGVSVNKYVTTVLTDHSRLLQRRNDEAEWNEILS